MKNNLPNTEIAPVTELPDSIRIPLHSLQADLGYLIGRVIADSSCGPMIIKSMLARLNQIEGAVQSTDVAATASEPVAYRVRHPTFNHGRWLFLAGRPVSSKDWKDIEPLYSSPQPAKTQKETL